MKIISIISIITMSLALTSCGKTETTDLKAENKSLDKRMNADLSNALKSMSSKIGGQPLKYEVEDEYPPTVPFTYDLQKNFAKNQPAIIPVKIEDLEEINGILYLKTISNTELNFNRGTKIIINLRVPESLSGKVKSLSRPNFIYRILDVPTHIAAVKIMKIAKITEYIAQKNPNEIAEISAEPAFLATGELVELERYSPPEESTSSSK